MNMKVIKYQIYIYLSLSLTACINEMRDYETCASEQLDRAVSYSLDVAPIIRSSCALPSCHVNGFENGDFTNFSQLREKAENGLLEMVIITNQMPPDFTEGPKPLTHCEKKIIVKWIDEGGPNN